MPDQLTSDAAAVIAEALWTARAEEAAADADNSGYGHFTLDEWADLPESVRKSRTWEVMVAARALERAGMLRAPATPTRPHCSQEPHPGIEFYGPDGGCAECGYLPAAASSDS